MILGHWPTNVQGPTFKKHIFLSQREKFSGIAIKIGILWVLFIVPCIVEHKDETRTYLPKLLRQTYNFE